MGIDDILKKGIENLFAVQLATSTDRESPITVGALQHPKTNPVLEAYRAHKGRMQKEIRELESDEFFKNPHIRITGREDGLSERIKNALSMFKDATRDKLRAQIFIGSPEYQTDISERKDLYALRAYFGLASNCFEKRETDAINERIRRIFLMDAYESIADIILFQKYPKEDSFGVFGNAITFYELLKTEAQEFIEWCKENNPDKWDISEAEHVLFTANMSLATLHLCLRDLGNSSKATLSALELMKSRNNPDGIEYSEYIPFRHRSPAYATFRFSTKRRNNFECIPAPSPFDGDYRRDYATPEKKAFAESVAVRRRISNRVLDFCHCYAQNDSAEGFDRDHELTMIFEEIALDPLNMKCYYSLFILENSNDSEDREIAAKAREAFDRILVKKAEIGSFELTGVHPNYPAVLTDGDVIIKKEPSEEAAQKHVAMLKFLRDNCKGLAFPKGRVHVTEAGDAYVIATLAHNFRNGKREQEFRACSLEDMARVYAGETGDAESPTPKQLKDFKKKKLMQVIDAIISFNSTGKRDKKMHSKYGLGLEDYDYTGIMRVKILPRIKLDEKRKQRVIQIAGELDKTRRTLCHCDTHTGNVLDTGESGVVIIDPVSASYASPFFDLVSLLEQEELELDISTKKELIDYFIIQSEAEGNEFHYNPLQQYMKEAIYVNLLFAKKCNNPKRSYYSPKARDRYIRKAKQLLHILDMG